MIGVTIWPLRKHKNLHFDNEQDPHMSSNNNEANRYRHDMDLLISSCTSCDVFHILQEVGAERKASI